MNAVRTAPELIIQLVSGFGDPNLIARMLPDSSVWPHYLALSLRSYRIPEITYWVGILLFLLAILLGTMRILTGREAPLPLFLRFLALGILWPLVVVTPGMNGCDTKYNTYPCVLKGEWQAQRVDITGGEVKVPVLAPDGRITTVPVAMNLKPVYKVTFNPVPSQGQGNDTILGRAIKGAWGQFNRYSNEALYREMARHQKGIGAVKAATNKLLLTVVVGAGVAGGFSTFGNYLSMLGYFPGLGGFLAGVTGNVVEGVADAPCG